MKTINKNTTVGLCLSGGGARGLAHIGILKALLEHNIKPTHISGTSMGAIIGVLYASGYSIDDMIHNANKLGWKEILPDWVEFWKEKKKSFLSIKYLRKILKSLPYTTLEQLPIPTSISVTGLDTGCNYIYQEGDIIDLVSASSAIPGLFDPIKYQGHWMIDGGISNNFPLEPLMDCDIIIGCDVNYCHPRTNNFCTRDILSRAMTISTNQAVQAKSSHCHLFIQPQQLDNYNILDFDKAQAITTLGYDEACRQLVQFTNH